MSDSQISALVSATTKEKLDNFTRTHGMKKNFVIEEALLFYMKARTELPDEAFIPTRFTLDDASFDKLAERLNDAPSPNQALRDLMNASDD